MSTNLVSRHPVGVRTLLLAAVVILTHVLPAQSYWVSGYVRYSSGWPFRDVSVSASGAGGSATTAPSGYYQLYVPSGWSGTVRASRSGYIFSPSPAKFSTVHSDVTANFTGIRSNKSTFTITGFIRTAAGAGIADVNVVAPDGASVATDSEGYYLWTVPSGWTGTLTPSKDGWSFSPPSTSYTEVWGDEASQDYTGMTQAWTLSGSVRTSSGTVVPEVTISVTKGGSSITTDSAGHYDLLVPEGWSGTVTPTKPGHTFEPSSRSYSGVAADQGREDYTATAPTWTLSGHVRASDGAGIPGVTLAADNGGGTATSDSSGYYRLIVLHGWSGLVTPSKRGYTFDPPSTGYGDVIFDQSDQNYVGTPAAVIYVDAAASGKDDGTSWANAFRSLQDALRTASAGDEIRVAQGVYRPDRGAGLTLGDRKAGFWLADGVTLKGGYAGAAATTPQTRDIQRYQTILSGDLKGNDTGSLSHSSRDENSYSVVTVEGVLETTTLDSLTIAGGNANGSASSGYSTGGGLAAAAADLILTQCTFRSNGAAGAGGGLVSRGGRLTLTHCSFVGNGGARGGGLCAGYGGSPTRLTLVNCAFLTNSAATSGGGVEIVSGSGTITNCTFNANTAASGGAVAGTGVAIANCVLWGSKPVALTGGTGKIQYSDVQGGRGQPWFGAGCLDVNPLFADSEGRLSSSSPCIDAGSNAAVPADLKTDLAGRPRIQRAVVDMGAYEMSMTPEDILNQAIALVQELPADSFTPSGSRGGLVSQLQAAVALLQAGLNRDALNSLRNEVLPLMDGCSRTGQPDDTDWIAACEAQQRIYLLVLEAVDSLARRTLTVSAAPGGSVIKPGEGTFVYSDGDSVSLEAVADGTYRFQRWSGTAVDAGKVIIPGYRKAKVLMDADYTVTATFERVEDFESGQLHEIWSTSSPAWYVTSYDAHWGQYSVRGGNLDSAGGRTTMTLHAEVTDGQITFWRRVRAPVGVGYYRFWIDGKLQEEVSESAYYHNDTDRNWTQVSVPVTAGSHTFEWEYSRSAYYPSSYGPDTVYIDDITLPAAP